MQTILNSDYFFFFIFISLITVIISDDFFTKKWIPFYYRYGIPLYRKRIPLLGIPANLQTYKLTLEKDFIDESGKSVLTFKALSESELAFYIKVRRHNRKSRQKRYSNAARGILRYDSMGNSLSLTGYLSWTNLLFPFLFFGFFLSSSDGNTTQPYFFFALFLFVFGFTAFHHWRAYGRIYQTVQGTFQDYTMTTYKTYK